MPQFSAGIVIDASAAAVFDFIAAIENMPLYVPTLGKASRLTADRVHLEGAANGRAYTIDGRLAIDAAGREVLLGGFEPESCQVALRVTAAEGGTELAGRIEFNPDLDAFSRDAQGSALRDMLLAILGAVKRAVEDRPMREPRAGFEERAPNPL